MPLWRVQLPITALVVAAAVFCSISVLDQVTVGEANVRLALLPPWWSLAGLAAITTASMAALGWWLRRRQARPPATLEDIVLPLASAGILTLPYLPVLADRWPAILMLAGPIVPVVWLVVGALQVRAIGQAIGINLRIVAIRPRAFTSAIFAATLAISGLVAWKLMPTAIYPGGDEPHYLVIAQSVWRDGDLDIFNNHQRGDHREYFNADLAPHYMAAGVDQGVYSVHPIGMPLLAAPVYAAAGYAGVAILMLLVGSATAALGWWWVRASVGASDAATFGWAAVACSAPYLLNAFTIYPEIFGGFCVVTTLVLVARTPITRHGVARHLAIGLALGALPWFSTKYAPMSGTLLLVTLLRLSRRPAVLVREPKAWAVLLPYVALVMAWCAFFYIYWGTPLPTAAYGENGQTSVWHLLRGAPGLLFDEEYGLLAFAPALVLAAPGLWSMLCGGGELRRLAIEVIAVFGALLGTVGAHLLWWGGSAPPGRPLVSGLFLLSLPIAVSFRAAPIASAQRTAQHLLLWVGIGIAGTLALAADGLLIDNGRDGMASLLMYWSPAFQLSGLVPSFVTGDLIHTWLQTVTWLAVACGTAVFLARRRASAPGAAALWAMGAFVAAVSLAAAVSPFLPGAGSSPSLDLAARTRLTALDRFDSRIRPVATWYEPRIRVTSAEAALPYLAVKLLPGVRTDRTPVRLIHNGRFSLPAGTYSVAVTFGAQSSPGPLPLSVQAGRAGRPLHTWQVDPRSGDVFRAELTLPVDLNFIGLRGPAELERAIDQVVITPIRVVDAHARPVAPDVLQATRYPAGDAFFHDENAHPEPNGFWVLGGRTVRLTIAPPAGAARPVVLGMHSGGQANTVRMTASGWSWQADLVPGRGAEVELPPAVSGVVPLTIETTTGFRPKDLNPASPDSRLLGIWVELKP